MSLRGAKRRGNPYSLQYHKTKRNTLGKYEKHDEFALSTTDLPSFPAGTRIATPVCALVRNDMLKTGRCQRLQGRLARGVCRRRWHVSGCKDAFRQYTGSAPLQPLTRIFLQHVIARSGATGQSVAVGRNEKQLFPANAQPLANLPGRAGAQPAAGQTMGACRLF